MGKTFVGQRVSKLDTGRPPEPVSRVTLVVDGENAYTAGDDTGRTIEKTVPWATQAMADAVLQSLRGVAYQPFEGLDAVLDPAAEIGDGITVAGVYSTLARADVTFDGLYTSDIAAPGGDEVEDEYPYQSRSQRQAQRELAKIRSSITKTAERITLLVENEIEGLSGKLELTASSLTAEINNTRDGLNSKLELTASNFQVQINGLNSAYSSIRQSVDSIGLGVYNGSDSSTITLYKDGIAIASQNISFTGMVTFNDLNGNHGTTIDGGAINTNTLKLNSLYGNYIYINDAFGQQAALITATGASSYAGQKFLLTSGAVEISATPGDLFLNGGGAYNATLQLGSGRASIGGDCIPNASGRYSCGSSGFHWTDVYANNGTIVTSDREKKKDIAYGLSDYSAFFDSLRPVSYRLKDGESGRTHLGLIAQDVEKAMADCGLTDMDFAGLIRSPREDGGYDYALRYGEFIPMLIYEYQMLSAEVEKLKRRLAA
ncbi:MAG: hypothetical protein HDT20_03820 [Oscillibacter sp.]|nr:hypothetical protein [Oscillibacter sp.]